MSCGVHLFDLLFDLFLLQDVVRTWPMPRSRRRRLMPSLMPLKFGWRPSHVRAHRLTEAPVSAAPTRAGSDSAAHAGQVLPPPEPLTPSSHSLSPDLARPLSLSHSFPFLYPSFLPPLARSLSRTISRSLSRSQSSSLSLSLGTAQLTPLLHPLSHQNSPPSPTPSTSNPHPPNIRKALTA